MAATPEGQTFHFGEFELDPRERRLLSRGVPIPLTPKVFDTLVFLVERAGRIVSKDELMAAIWPRRVVEESNLGKYIWTIRRALGESADVERYIETVPKLGYRFIAPVTLSGRAVAAVETSAHHALPEVTVEVVTAVPRDAVRPARAPSQRLAAGLVLVSLLVIIAAAVTVLHYRARQAPRVAASGARIAITGFSNLTQSAQVAWLAPALKTMLGTELGTNGTVQIVPEELVADASSSLRMPAGGGYAPQALTALRRRLDADYVLSGSYLAGNGGKPATLRIDIALQDARSGALVASVSQEGAMEGLSHIVALLGAEATMRLGVRVRDPRTESMIATAQPPMTEVARHMGLARENLEHYDAAHARDELLEAIALAPDYAPAYAALSQAWSALGYRQRALAAAEQAAQHAADLPPDLRLPIDAAVQTAQYDVAGAAGTWQKLVELRPAVVEYRLQYIGALQAAGQLKLAGSTLVALRALPGAAADPRVSLAAASLAGALSDPRAEFTEATTALRQARAREAPGLIADAERRLASSLFHLSHSQSGASQEDAAVVELNSSIRGYQSLGNPLGEARARFLLASIYDNQNRKADAAEEIEHASALFQLIGDRGGVSAVYQHQAEVLWGAGDRDGAEVAARHVLEFGRELGDLKTQSWGLTALATIESDEAATDDTLAQYREANSINERLGGDHSTGYSRYADVARLRGDLADAHQACEHATAAVATEMDPQNNIIVDSMCAQVDVDRGQTDAATRTLKEALRLVQTTSGNDIYSGNAHLILAQLDLDAGRWADARDKLRVADTEFVHEGSQTGEAVANALLALAAQSLGNTVERDRAAARARALRMSMTARQEVFAVDIVLAQLANTTGERAKTVATLEALAADAERRHWVSWSLEAQLVSVRLLAAAPDRSAADTRLKHAEAEARAHGFGRILALLAQVPGPH